ncbi:MAG TPA: translocation/assembly module TamB domain-containing protein, partial [Longimicrobiaceae bacterium]
LRGTWKAPEYGGHAALRQGGLLLASTGMRVTDGVADLRLTGDTLRLDSLVARSQGPLRAWGTVDLTDRSHPMVNLAATGSNLRVMDATRGLVDLDGQVTAVGPLDAIHVTGRAEMLHGFLALKQFNKNLLRVKAPRSLSFFTVYDTTRPALDRARAEAEQRRKRRVGVIADLEMVVDRGSYYRNRPDANTEFFTGEGEAVQAHLDTCSGDSWAVGFVRIGGGIAIFRASPFEPKRGTLTFQPWTGSPGMLEQVGERSVWEPGRGWFPLQLLTGGTSKSPSLGLESGTLFPIRGRELNQYLTIGRERLTLLQQSGSSLSGSEAWSGQLSGETGALARRQQAATALGVVLHDIGTGATKEFGLDAFSVSPGDVPTELVFGKTGGVRGALVEGGRYVTTERYIAAQMRLTTGIPGLRVEQRFGTTYRLDLGLGPRFLFRDPEELGLSHPTVRTGVFGAFLTRYWDW